MDKNALTVLQTDIQGQMDLIDKIFAKLEERAIELTPDKPAIMESVAYQIHNLYNAVEDLLKIVAAHFENQITDTARWHSALLQRMTQGIPGIRPRLRSESSYLNLNNARFPTFLSSCLWSKYRLHSVGNEFGESPPTPSQFNSGCGKLPETSHGN